MRVRFSAVLVISMVSLIGCRRGAPVIEFDHPRLTPEVRAIDTTVHSAALGKDMPLRIVIPANTALAARELPVVYFLHGAGTNLHDWTNNSDIASFAAQGFVLAFIDAPGSYYIDDLRSSHNRYEQYITREIPATVHASVPTATRHAGQTAIVGISRGGYGAVVLGLKHPELYGFIGSLSGALDMNLRHFHWSHPVDSQDIDRAFGPLSSPTRRENDVYRLLARLPSTQSPYFFVACGESDGLLPLSQRFAQRLASDHHPSEQHFAPGAHNWGFWGAQLPTLEAALHAHLDAGSNPSMQTALPVPAGTR